MVNSCAHGNESSGSIINCRKFLEQTCNYQLSMKCNVGTVGAVL
jgi:hypothetical protein